MELLPTLDLSVACAVTDISKGNLLIIKMEINFIDWGLNWEKNVHCNLLRIPEYVT